MPEEVEGVDNTEIESSKMLVSDQKAAGGRSGTRTAYNDFVRKLFAILESGDYTSIISWTKEGNSFVVVDTNKFTTNILPKHFKHSNFSSFVRQLNKYDFHKVKRTPEERQHSEYGEYSWEFQHPRFRRNDEAALDRIKRKTVTQKKVALTEDIIGSHHRSGSSDSALISTAELTATTNMVLNNCVSKAKFNQLKKRTDNMELFNQQLQAENSNLQIEVQKLAAKCNAMMDNIFALKSINDTLLSNFNSLVSTLVQQGIKLPPDLQGVDQSFSQGSGDPSPVASQSTMHAAALETAPSSSIPAVSPCASKNLPLVDNVALRPGFHVLLVEDNSVCIELCCKFLRKYGCSVEVVTDGLSAIETIEKFRFDLVLMDIVMPNLDGATATSVIRGFDNQTPIIAMTANIEDQDLVTYLQHGMNDILAKPFTKDDLHSMLIRYLNDRVPLTEQASIANQGLTAQGISTQGLATQHASV